MSTYTGSQVSESLSSSRRDIERQISDIDHDLRATEKVIAGRNGVREDTLIKLADIFLADNGALASQFRDVNGRIQAIFTEKVQRRAAVDDQIVDLQSDEQGIQSKIASSQRDIDGAEKVIADIVAKIGTDLDALPEYPVLVKEVDALRATVTKDAESLAAAQTEYEAKLAEYRADPFFTYLNARGFGTPVYKAGWFNADKWLANLTDYAINLRQYQILTQLPERISAANEVRVKALTAKTAQRDALTKSVESKHGLPGARATLKIAVGQKASRLEQLTLNHKAQAAMRAEKAAIDSGADPFLKRAKQELKTLFGSQSVADLRAMAQATATDRDDKLVDILEQAEMTVNDQRRVAKKLIGERDGLAPRLAKAKRLEARFSSENYDSRNSRFSSGLDINSLMIGYLAGSYSEAQVFGTLESSHSTYREPTYSSSSYSSSSSDSSYSSSSSSSWSDSSSSSGGGFGGGDSSSGGGF
jgi:uncharacterized membrane protein YgcG